MREPIVITTSDPNATEVVVKTVWHCTKPGKPGMMVYDQMIALRQLSEGYDIEIGQVIRLPQSRSGKGVTPLWPKSVRVARVHWFMQKRY